MSRHGSSMRGTSSALRSSTSTGRYGRMFRWLPSALPYERADDIAASREAVDALATTMIDREFAIPRADGTLDPPDGELSVRDNPHIPAGYTYLGQFIDHDITFDPLSTLMKANDPDSMIDFRTPGLDLDSMYGGGPALQPYLYAIRSGPEHLRGVAFELGASRGPRDPRIERFDLLRTSREETAIIPDPRNDENRIVSQLHALFQSFHNKLAAHLFDTAHSIGDSNTAGLSLFDRVQQEVRWHFQWIVLNDFLPRIIGKHLAEQLVSACKQRRPAFKFYNPSSGDPYMPVEFSAAAFRFGHSMIRSSYTLNDSIRSSDRRFNRIPIFSPPSAPGLPDRPRSPLDDLAGGQPLPISWGIDWRRFFDGFTAAPAPQPSFKLDTLLTDPLNLLPGDRPDSRSLAVLNLRRGLALGLPSGQAVARAMEGAPIPDLWEGREDVVRSFPALRDNAPLWFYILREAERLKSGDHYSGPEIAGGACLGPVGGRIVGEVLVGLIWMDHHSYLYQAPAWTPTLAVEGGFRMKDLIEFVDRPR